MLWWKGPSRRIAVIIYRIRHNRCNNLQRNYANRVGVAFDRGTVGVKRRRKEKKKKRWKEKRASNRELKYVCSSGRRVQGTQHTTAETTTGFVKRMYLYGFITCPGYTHFLVDRFFRWMPLLSRAMYDGFETSLRGGCGRTRDQEWVEGPGQGVEDET